MKDMLTAFCLTLIFLAFIPATAYGYTRGVVVGDRVNVRSCGSINNSNRLFQVERGQKVDILAVSGQFFRVSVEDKDAVYIAREWVRVSETLGTVLGEYAWIYNIPEEDGGHRLTTVNGGEILTVTSYFNGWYGIDLWGETAFIKKSNVNTPDFIELPRARISAGNRLACQVIDFAMDYIGTRYVFGGTSPSGFDCSGFMTYILRNFGINVNRHSGDMARNGYHVERNEIQRGDLVFFSASRGGRISHVGMYIGDGNFIHSSSWRTGVRIDNMNQAYYIPRFVTARRVL